MASTVSSSDRPLAWRTMARSNERPMTAAADSTWPAVSLTEAIRSRSSAWTPRGSDVPGGSPLASAATRCSGSPFRVDDERVDQGVVRVVRSDGTDDRRRRGTIEATEGQDGRAGQAGQAVDQRFAPARQVLASPGQQQEHRTIGEPAGEVGDRLARRIVGEVQVVDPDEPRPRSGARAVSARAMASRSRTRALASSDRRHRSGSRSGSHPAGRPAARSRAGRSRRASRCVVRRRPRA